ncbi:MAG: hypothetical protein EAZ43_12600 [Betaproteobacteria bacterium]|nr:MAG: hypothetical protein EAZ43_12600 [Betaproteobacteria bacterium]
MPEPPGIPAKPAMPGIPTNGFRLAGLLIIFWKESAHAAQGSLGVDLDWLMVVTFENSLDC